jgi:hypothetical protein
MLPSGTSSSFAFGLYCMQELTNSFSSISYYPLPQKTGLEL